MSVIIRRSFERQFHSAGPEKEKARSANFVRGLGFYMVDRAELDFDLWVVWCKQRVYGSYTHYWRGLSLKSTCRIYRLLL